MDGVVDSLLANSAISGAVEWVKSGHNVIWAVVAIVVVLRLIGFIGAYCQNCGSREKAVDVDATVLATLTKTVLGGAFSYEEGHACAGCGKFWSPSGFWKGLGACIAVAAIAMGLLVWQSVKRDRAMEPEMIYSPDYGR